MEDSFSKQYEKFGTASDVTRLSDKHLRVESLTPGAKNDVSDENIRGTLMDLANYAIATVMEMGKQGGVDCVQ